MSNLKHRIELGNCEPGLGRDITKPKNPGLWKADSIIITADSITATADGLTT